MLSRISSCLLLISFLSACGGGGGGGFSSVAPTPAPTPPPPVVHELPGGLWIGTLTDDLAGVTVDAEAISIDSGEFRIITAEGAHFVGNMQVNGSDFTGSGTGYAPEGFVWSNGAALGTLSANGTIDERVTFSGDWQLNTGESGTFSFAFDSFYDNDSSLALVADSWTLVDEFDSPIGSILIDDAGRLDGQDNAGCMYTGNVAVIDATSNVYDMRVTVINCDTLNGSYSGLGFLLDVNSQNDEFVYLVDKGTFADVGYLIR